MHFLHGLYSEIIWIVWMVFGYIFSFIWFRTLYMEFIHIKCGLYGIYSDIMWFVQLFGLTFLLEGATASYVQALCFGAHIHLRLVMGWKFLDTTNT